MAAQWAHHEAALLRVDAEGRIAAAGGLPQYCGTSGEYDPKRHVLVGLAAGRPVFTEDAALPAGTPTLRTVMDDLGILDLQVAFTAAGLVIWHRNAAHCGVCGAATSMAKAGAARVCPGCARESFPRTDPAVIVAVLDPSGRLLLGRQPSWPPGRASVFAGFVESGESLEQAVHREVAEEVGLPLTAVRYLGSQPWPFPRSLMVGFVARAGHTRVSVAVDEIESARWFTPAELASSLAVGDISLPSPTSIAFRMIGAWRNGRLTVA